MSEFRDKAIVGVSWSVVSQIGRQALTVLTGVVLARLLSPAEFGLLGMVTVVTGFAAVFAEMGFGAALVHRQDVGPRHISSVFWLNVGSGILLSLLFILGAPLLGWFYHEPTVVPITMVMASVFVIQSLGIIQQTLFSKSIDFKALSIAEVTAVALAGGAAIVAALGGLGVWSLVVLRLGTALVTTISLWLLSSWRPRWLFDWGALKELLGFSASLVGERSMNYWVRNLDDLLIGRLFGTNDLGVYRWAYTIMLFPLENISQVIARVMFPSLSSIQHQKERVKQVFLRMTRTIALITFPLMLGLLVTARPFVLAVFGPDWAAMIPILRILSLVGMVQSIVTLVGSLFLSQGAAGLQFRIGLLIKPLLIIGIVVGLNWGIVGVAAGYAVAVAIAQFPNLYYSGRLVGMRYVELVRNVAGIFACAALMATVVFGTGFLLPDTWRSSLELVVQVSLGVVVYLGLIHAVGLTAYHEMQDLVRERWAVWHDQSSSSA